MERKTVVKCTQCNDTGIAAETWTDRETQIHYCDCEEGIRAIKWVEALTK